MPPRTSAGDSDAPCTLGSFANALFRMASPVTDNAGDPRTLISQVASPVTDNAGDPRTLFDGANRTLLDFRWCSADGPVTP